MAYGLAFALAWVCTRVFITYGALANASTMAAASEPLSKLKSFPERRYSGAGGRFLWAIASING